MREALAVNELDTLVVGPLFERAALVEAQNADLFESLELGQHVKSLVRASKRLGGRLWGASSVGDRLIGAMLMCDPTLKLWRPNDGDGDQVVLIDGIVDGPTRLEFVAWTMRQTGAAFVNVAVVEYLAEDRPNAVDRVLVGSHLRS